MTSPLAELKKIAGIAGNFYSDFKNLQLQDQKSKKSWSVSGKLVQATSSSFSGAANFKDIETYTVQFSVIPPALVGPNNPTRTIAEVLWSVEGNTARRVLSVTNGAAISGRGELVRVIIREDSALVPILPPSNPTYVVSALITKGVRPNVETPPILYTNAAGTPRGTTAIVNVPSGIGAGILIPIPKDAGVVSVFLSAYHVNLVPPPLDLNGMLAIQTAEGSVVDVAKGDFRVFNTWWPICPGAASIRIQNFTDVIGANIVEVTPIFGIEG